MSRETAEWLNRSVLSGFDRRATTVRPGEPGWMWSNYCGCDGCAEADDDDQGDEVAPNAGSAQ